MSAVGSKRAPPTAPASPGGGDDAAAARPPRPSAAALAAARAASRVAFVRSELAAPFTWVDARASALACSLTLALALAHVWQGYSLAAIACHVGAVALLLAAAIHLHNSLNAGSVALPQLSIPLGRASVARLAALLADRAGSAVEAANAALSWEQPAASARALAYVWLAGRLAWLAAPGYLFTGASRHTRTHGRAPAHPRRSRAHASARPAARPAAAAIGATAPAAAPPAPTSVQARWPRLC
jgi:hypothetical protein